MKKPAIGLFHNFSAESEVPRTKINRRVYQSYNLKHAVLMLDVDSLGPDAHGKRVTGVEINSLI